MIPPYSAILCYHRVATIDNDPYDLTVEPASFAEQLRQIQNAGPVFSLNDLTRNRSQGGFVVTFDDGYADNLVAAEIAAGLGMPITVFVTAGIVDRVRSFWWDRLAAIVRRIPSQSRAYELDVGGHHFTAHVGDEAGRDRLLFAIHRRMKLHVTDGIEDAIDAVASQLGVDPAADAADSLLSGAQVNRLAAMANVTLGAHTVTHPRLSRISEDEQEYEIRQSLSILRELTNSRVSHFAYPFGGADDFSRATARLVRGAGFSTAVTTLPGLTHRMSPRFRLPRFVVGARTTIESVMSLVSHGRGASV